MDIVIEGHSPKCKVIVYRVLAKGVIIEEPVLVCRCQQEQE